MEQQLYFIITGYNCGQYLENCFDSLLRQSTNRWHAVVVDDGSLDNSTTVIKRYKTLYPEKFTVLFNTERRYKAYGFIKAIELLPDDAVIAELDADDALWSDTTVADILSLHQRYDVVYTNHKTSNYSSHPWEVWRSTPLPAGWTRNYPERTETWNTKYFPGHLRTFKKYLFQLIQPDVFYFENQLIKAAFDMVYYTCVLEMAPLNKIFFHDVDCYHYCIRNNNEQFTEEAFIAIGKRSENKIFCQTQIDEWFKSLPPYQRLKKSKMS